MVKPGVKKCVFAAVALLLVCLIALVATEVLLRVMHRQPWIASTLAGHEPTIYEPDSVIGWRKQPGEYRLGPYVEGGVEVSMTFLKNGRRATSVGSTPTSDSRVILVGGSFTQGFAVSDQETFAWRLQERLPNAEVMNYGTGGYGTYQSLLMLERVLDEPDARPTTVIYSFIEHHEDRNVAVWGWLRLLTQHSHRGLVRVPYCTMSAGGELVRHEPIAWPRFPMRESLSVVGFAEEILVRWWTKGNYSQRRRVTEALMLEMDRVCKEAGARFMVTVLESTDKPKEGYLEFLSDHGVVGADCTHKEFWSPQMRVPGEGHPNGTMHAYWADCIEEALRSRVLRN